METNACEHNSNVLSNINENYKDSTITTATTMNSSSSFNSIVSSHSAIVPSSSYNSIVSSHSTSDIIYSQLPYSAMYHQMASYNMMASHHYTQQQHHHSSYHQQLFTCEMNNGSGSNFTQASTSLSIDGGEDRKPSIDVSSSSTCQSSQQNNNINLQTDERKPMIILEPLITLNTTSDSENKKQNKSNSKELPDNGTVTSDSQAGDNTITSDSQKEDFKICCICRAMVCINFFK